MVLDDQFACQTALPIHFHRRAPDRKKRRIPQSRYPQATRLFGQAQSQRAIDTSMRKGERAHVDITTSQAAHSTIKLCYELNRLAAQSDTKIAAHAIRLLRWAAAHQQQRLARKIAQHDARDGTPSAAAQDEHDDQNDDDEIDRENEPDDERDYDDDCDQQQQQPARLSALPRAGAEARARWALARASGALYKNRCGTGNAAGTAEALRTWNHISVVCSQDGCHALVDLKAARRQARAQGRANFLPGDGCAGPACSADYRRNRFANRQLAQADQIDSRERLLARWPTDRMDDKIYVHDGEFASAEAAKARQAVKRPTT